MSFHWTKGRTMSLQQNSTCCNASVQINYVEKHITAHRVGEKAWYTFITNTINSYISKMLTSLFGVIKTFSKKSILYQACIVPNLQFFHNLPCGYTKMDMNSKGTYSWAISVHMYFSINIIVTCKSNSAHNSRGSCMPSCICGQSNVML